MFGTVALFLPMVLPAVRELFQRQLQVTLNHFVFGMLPSQAVAARRFHHQWFPNVLRMESGIPRAVHQLLRHEGHQVDWISAAGIKQSVSLRADDLPGAADLRKYGGATGF